MRKTGLSLAIIMLGFATQLLAADIEGKLEVKSAVAGVETQFTVARESGGADQEPSIAAPSIVMTDSQVAASTPAQIDLPKVAGEMTLDASRDGPGLRMEISSAVSGQGIIVEGRSIRLQWDNDGRLLSVQADRIEKPRSKERTAGGVVNRLARAAPARPAGDAER